MVDATGRAVTPPSRLLDCPPQARQRTCFTELTRLGHRQQVTYQPAGRFWVLQWYETAIYLVLTLLLAGACTRSIRRLS
jgi:hypothetical protein